LFTVGDVTGECDYGFDETDDIVQRLLDLIRTNRADGGLP
jgi:hypothetical protein